MNLDNLLGIDLETGGLTPGRHPIIAIAAHPAWPQAPFRILVRPRPDEPIDPAAVAVNGYDRDLWKKSGAVPIEEAIERLRGWLAARPGTIARPEPVAHNAGFERSFLDAAVCPEAPLFSHRWECSQATLRAAQRAGLVGGTSSSLDALADLTGQPRPAVHTADVDARICLTGYLWLLRRMRPGLLTRLLRRLVP